MVLLREVPVFILNSLLMNNTFIPSISISIPVCGRTLYLERCLTSVFSQTFDSFEILIIDDSPAEDDSAERQVHSIMGTLPNEQKKRIRYIQHGENLGCMEARRRAVESALGKYLLYIDSDDELASPDACRILYEAAVKKDADIVFAAAELAGDRLLVSRKRYDGLLSVLSNKIFDGNTVLPLCQHIFIRQALTTFVWAKLFRTETLLNAFSEIPQMYCCNKEDMVIMLFASLAAQRYAVLTDVVYRYYLGGLTSTPGQKDMEQWRKVCSSSSAFVAMIQWLKDRKADNPEYGTLEKVLTPVYFSAVRECINIFDKQIPPEIHDEALCVLNDSWEEEVVANVRRAMQKDS